MNTRHIELVGLSSRLTMTLVIFLTGLSLSSCSRAVKTQVEIKSLSLNPERFIGTKVKINGQLTGVGPADSYLLVEDASGRIMVGTEQIAQKISCPKNSKVELVGTLRRLKNLPQPYFSMENLVHCGP